MKVKNCKIPEIKLIYNDVHLDSRGTFIETYKPHYVHFVQIKDQGMKQLKNRDSLKSAQKHILDLLYTIKEPIKVSTLKNIVTSPHSVCKSLAKKGILPI